MRKVTLNGDVVETSNLMTGGAYKSMDQGGFISSEEAKIPTIELELNHLKKEEDSYIKRIKDIETDISLNYKKRISNNNELSDMKQNLAVLNDNLSRKEKELKDFYIEISRIESEIKNYSINLENEQLKLNEVNEILAKLINEENEIKSKLSLIENNDFTKKISLLKNEINELEKNNININLDITKLTTQLDEIINVRESEIKDAINSFLPLIIS
jgi:chromosome segregation ATPase